MPQLFLQQKKKKNKIVLCVGNRCFRCKTVTSHLRPFFFFFFLVQPTKKRRNFFPYDVNKVFIFFNNRNLTPKEDCHRILFMSKSEDIISCQERERVLIKNIFCLTILINVDGKKASNKLTRNWCDRRAFKSS